MSIFTKNQYKPVRFVIPEFMVSSTASVADSSTISINSTSRAIGENFSVTLVCTTGTVWFNPLVTATTANGYKLNESDFVDLLVRQTVSIIADTTTAKVQALIWGE